MELLEFIKGSADILVSLIIISAAIGYFVLLKGVPGLYIRIIPRWFDVDDGLLIIHIALENTAKIKVFTQSCKLQICEYAYPEKHLSEWVWFEDPINKPKTELKGKPIPLFYDEPIKIFTSTTCLNPRESAVIECMHRVNPNNVTKIGVQYKSSSLADKYKWLYSRFVKPGRWTQTIIVDPPILQDQSNKAL